MNIDGITAHLGIKINPPFVGIPYIHLYDQLMIHRIYLSVLSFPVPRSTTVAYIIF